MKQTLIVTLLLAVACLAGCRKNIQTNEAVRQAILNHLSENKNLAMNSMDIEVRSVTYRDKEADVVVMFKPKGGDASSGMSMNYTLEQQNGVWAVKRKSDTSPHGTAAAKALSDAAAKQEQQQQQGEGSSIPMPSGHPGMGGGAAEPKK